MWAEKDEKKKEILTNDMIKKDIFKVSLERFTFAAPAFSIIIIIIFLFMYIYSSYHHIPLITISILCCFLINEIILIIRRFVQLKNNEFNVVTDTVIGKEEETTKLFYYVFSLNFKCYGSYEPKKITFNTSFVGDEFYLVIINNKIKYAYKCNQFKYIP